jgi:class 3 adenylate cyclase/tetratricopeptide (TPR) repeat protein
MSCPSCGSEVAAGARFCQACGHPVQARGDERRIATVLFADLAGFTGLSETLDPEHLKNVLDRCFARLALDVTNHGGRVDKVVGDAIVALFGAPVAHEDDAERAVRTGLQMQRTIESLAAEMAVPLLLRVGINSGEVLVGAMRAGGDYTAMGDAVNVAARLQTMAAPGSVVVGPATYAATASVVRFEVLGSLQARGREAPVEAWRAIESVSVPGRRPRRVDAPLIGRDDEMTVLRQTVATAIRKSRPSMVFLLGEAGMGKSRLIEDAAEWAACEHGALVLEGRCVPYGEANPWWPIAEAVRTACGVEPGDTATVTAAKVEAAVARLSEADDGGTDAADLAAGLLHLMGDEDALPDVDPQRARREARRALHALIAGLARRQPVVIVLSEMHWADEVVLDLFGWHLDRLSGLPVVVLCSARFELMERWTPPHGRFNLLTLHLDPLDPSATRELAGALGASTLPIDVVDTLIQRSGGNPFFLEELLTFVGEGANAELPVTLRGLVAARIDALPGDERSVLEDAAVIGRSGTLSILRALSGSRGVEDVDEVVGRLLDRDLLATSAGRWEFRSEVVREVAYGTLTKSERAGRHWRVGSWLTEAGRRTGRADEMTELVAHHFATAAELVVDIGPISSVPANGVDVAVAAVEKAAAWASRRELPLAAVRLLDRGVLLAPEGSPTRSRLLIDRALEQATLREMDAARLDLDAALPVGEPDLQARHLTVQGVIEQFEGDLARSADTLRRAITAWRVTGDRAGEGEALRRYGLTCMMASDTEGAEEALNEALAIARDLGSRRDEAWALWHLAEMSFYGGRNDEAENRLRDAGQAFLEAGDSGGQGWVRGLLGYLKFVQGHREEAEILATSILDDLREREDRWALGMVLVLLASVRLWQGKAEAAAEHASEARQAFVAIHDLPGELRATGILARAFAAIGRSDEAWAIVHELVAQRDGATLGTPDMAVAGLAVHLGDGATALQVLAEADITAFVEEVAITRGSARLFVGQVSEALDELEALQGTIREASGGATNLWSSLGLARSSVGDAAGAFEAARFVQQAGPVATYRDLVLARLASAFAHFQQGQGAESELEIESARATATETDDVVTAAVVELAAARLSEASGRAGADEDVAAARARLDLLGASSAGWDTALRTAVMGMAPTA